MLDRRLERIRITEDMVNQEIERRNMREYLSRKQFIEDVERQNAQEIEHIDIDTIMNMSRDALLAQSRNH